MSPLYASRFDEANVPQKCIALWGRDAGELYDCISPCGPINQPNQIGYFHLSAFNCLSSPPDPVGSFCKYPYYNEFAELEIVDSPLTPSVTYISDASCDPKYGGVATQISFASIDGGTIVLTRCGTYQQSGNVVCEEIIKN